MFAHMYHSYRIYKSYKYNRVNIYTEELIRLNQRNLCLDMASKFFSWLNKLIEFLCCINQKLL